MRTESVTTATAISPESTRQLNRFYLVLGLILLIGLLGRVFHFYWTIGSDDQRYIIASRSLTQSETVSVPSHIYPRIVWRSVLALWGLPFGLTLQTSAVLLFLLSASSIVLVALIARLLFDDQAALLAAALHATYPINVQYDPVSFPDSLAVPLMLLSVFFFIRFLQESRTHLLGAAAFTAGMLFGVKEYFVLIAVPFGLSLLFGEMSFSKKRRYLSLLVLFFAAGFSVDPLLHALESGNPLGHFRPLMTYSARYAELYEVPSYYTGLHQLYFLITGRFDYLRWVLFDYGVVGGFLMLLGALFLGFSWRKSESCFLLFSAVLVFVLFLSAMPIGLQPPRFVETQPRYSMLFLPLLAIGAGAACWSAWKSLSDKVLRSCAVVLIVLASIWNLWVPNSMAAARSLEMVGIRQTLERATQSGVSKVVLPLTYDQLIPDSYYRRGATVVFAKGDTKPPVGYGEVEEFLSDQTGTGFFVPATKAEGIADKLTSLGFKPAEVRVPETSVRSWLDRIGIHSEGQLVGWLYTRSQPTK